MEILEVATIPVIVFIVYWVINLLKLLTKNNENFLKFIPLIATGLGAVLGVVVFYAVPEVMATENVLNAIMIGAASGSAATGVNQIFKQLIKNNDTEKQQKGD